MIFYHGTSKENWELIKQEGVLFGVRERSKEFPYVSRCTYLATDKDEAAMYGEVLLRVEYNPFTHPTENNWVEGCWQCRVYEPIELKYVTKL